MTAPDASPAPPDDSLAALIRQRVSALLSALSGEAVEGLHPVVMREVERALLGTVLEHAGGHRGEAARLLGLHRNTLRLRLRATGLESVRPRHSRRRSRP